MSIIATKLNAIKPSATFALVKKVTDLRIAGRNILSFTVGEPDADTPENVQEAAIKAIKAGKNRYTNVDGSPALKKAIQSKFLRENNLTYELDNLIASTGGKQVIYNAFMASLDIADEVIIPAPYWVSYPDMVKICGGVPVVVNCPFQDDFKLTAPALKNAITPRTKWLVMNSPSNPTGAVYTEAELTELAHVLLEHPQIYIMSDDIYEHIIFDGMKFANILSVCPQLKERTLLVNGVSKSYAMTGWRLGYGAGPKDLIKAMTLVQSQATSNPCSIAQEAAIEALSGDQSFVHNNVGIYQERRDVAFDALKECHGLVPFKAAGAFYIFVSCEQFIGRTMGGKLINNCSDFAEYLLDSVGVAVVPGEPFGAINHFRISTALSMTDLKNGIAMIKDACSR